MRSLRFLTLMLAALSMSMTVSHLLQMPAKLAYPGPVWLLLQQTLYDNSRALGQPVELGALACALALALLVRARRPALSWTLLASACLLGAQAAWWLAVVPVNTTIAQYTPPALPPDWTLLRVQWEYAHALRAVLQGSALGALVLSVVAEQPRRY